MNFSTLQQRTIASFLSSIFLVSLLIPSHRIYAQNVMKLPEIGTMLVRTASFIPPIVRGMTIYPQNPFQFDFIIDAGDNDFNSEVFTRESLKLIKYFLTALTVPENEMWVNLSPYERNRIIAKGLGQTEMGRDMLTQDYILKQLSASLMHPESSLGEDFWRHVYGSSHEKYGSLDIPLNTFNKIWIIPEKAEVSIHGTNVFVAESRLKVMLEEDYLALNEHINNTKHGLTTITKDAIQIIKGESSDIIRDVLIPEIEKEINNGEHFANLRQIYHSMILATWYKQNLRNSILGQVYIEKNRLKGIDLQDKIINQQIYDQYVKSFEEGVFNFIKEDYDVTTRLVIPRKYFSGGLDLAMTTTVAGDAAVEKLEDILADRPNQTVKFSLETDKGEPISVVSMQDDQKSTEDRNKNIPMTTPSDYRVEDSMVGVISSVSKLIYKIYIRNRSGLGSGFFVGEDDKYVYVLTNHHVIQYHKEISIFIPNSKESSTIPAEVIAIKKRPFLSITQVMFSFKGDMALLRVDKANLPEGYNAPMVRFSSRENFIRIGSGHQLDPGAIYGVDYYNSKDLLLKPIKRKETKMLVFHDKDLITTEISWSGASGGFISNSKGRVVGMSMSTTVSGKLNLVIPLTELLDFLKKHEVPGVQIENSQTEGNVPDMAIMSLVKKEEVGGIDFNSNMMDLKTQGKLGFQTIPVNMQSLHHLQIDGLVPVIYQIVPTSMPNLINNLKK